MTSDFSLCTTVLADLVSHLSSFDFGKAVKNHHADKGVRILSTYDVFKMMAYGLLSGASGCGIEQSQCGLIVQKYSMPVYRT
ncbi:MAG: DUF4372 domain-containing protein [Treponema sp.]|jgi:hypothetical protein|nr:DUF4372 domain-containing protein [Treponema sp.]